MTPGTQSKGTFLRRFACQAGNRPGQGLNALFFPCTKNPENQAAKLDGVSRVLTYYRPLSNTYATTGEITKPGTDSEIRIGLFKNSSFEHISGILFSCTTTLGKLTSLLISLNGISSTPNRLINIRNDYEPPFFKIQEVTKENPEELTDGLFLFHNPFARNKIPKDYFRKSNVIHATYANGDIILQGNNLPIFSRLNMPKILFPDHLIDLIAIDFNGI
ncbi:MAG: hypothetical protein H6581_09985 [Bacteroidia bacterium]|nr:hypothetical protein [Bacteroidia bacterium]